MFGLLKEKRFTGQEPLGRKSPGIQWISIALRCFDRHLRLGTSEGAYTDIIVF